MTSLKKYICECCGGKIDRATMRCEYCGTEYKEDTDRIIRIETYSNPVRRYTAGVVLTNEFIYQMGNENAAEIATSKLVDKLSEAIRENMLVVVERDELRQTQNIRGYIKMIHPMQVSDMERIGS